MNVFKKNYVEDVNTQLHNYAFKYINVESEDQFFDYNIYRNNATLEYKDERNNDNVTITVTFNRIDIGKDEANITYFLKIVDSKFYVPKEKFDTVAVTESPYYTKYKRNPEWDPSNNKITLSATGNFQHWRCIQVIAQIQQNKVLEYIAYDSFCTDKNQSDDEDKEENEKKEPTDKKNNTALLIGISVSLALLIIALAVIVFYFQKKK